MGLLVSPKYRPLKLSFFGILIIIWFLFRSVSSPSKVFSYIPSHSPIVIEWTNGMNVWNHIASDSSKWFYDGFGTWDTWLHSVNSTLRYRSFVSALLVCGASDLQWIHLMQLDNDPIFSDDISSIVKETTTYKGNDIYTLEGLDNEPVFALNQEDYWIFSSKSIALELTIEALQSDDRILASSPNFISHSKTNKTGLGVYLQPAKWNELLGLFHPNITFPDPNSSPNWIYVNLDTSEESADLHFDIYSDFHSFSDDKFFSSDVFSLLTNDIASFYYKTINKQFEPSFAEYGLLLQRQPVNASSFYETDRLALLKITDSIVCKTDFEDRSATGMYLNFEIHYLEDTLSLFDGLDALSASCWIRLNDYALFSATDRGLKKWIDLYMTGQLLQEDRLFYERVFGQDTLTLPILYADLKDIQPYVLAILGRPLPYVSDYLNECLRSWSTVHMINGRANESSGKGVISRKKQTNRSRIMTSWTFYAGTNISYGPYIAISESGDQSNEVFIQDESGFVYCLDNNGQELFDTTLRFENKLVGLIHKSDFFGTGQSFYLMTTEYGLRVVSGSGKIAKSLNFVARTRSGIQVFNIAGDSYLFVPCENGYVYAYDNYFRPVGIWARNRIGPPPIHLYSTSDIVNKGVVCVSQDGAINQFSLDGQRINKFDTGQDSLIYLDYDPLIDRLVGQNSEGTLTVLNNQGQFFKLSYPSFSESNSTSFLYTDCFGDSRKDYIRLINNKEILSQYYSKEGGVDQFKTASRNKTPTIHDLKVIENSVSDWKFVGYDTIDQKIHFFNNTCQLEKEVSLLGQAPIAILSNSEVKLRPQKEASFFIITKYGNKLTTYLMGED